MSEFNLMILTPEREFYNGKAEGLLVEAEGGQLYILADHAPIVAALSVGALKIKNGAETLEAFHSEGFMEVRDGTAVVLLQACEWPHEIDVKRAEEAQRRAEKRLAQHLDNDSVARSKIALTRALMRIKVKTSSRRYSRK